MAAMFIEECSLKKISSEKKAVVWKSVRDRGEKKAPELFPLKRIMQLYGNQPLKLQFEPIKSLISEISLEKRDLKQFLSIKRNLLRSSDC